MITDPIADFLTSIRNALQANHRTVEVKSSSLKKHITQILCDQGYIRSFAFNDDKGYQGVIRITLKYDAVTKQPVIKKLVRVSKPGCREFREKNNLPRVLGGLGIAIISTSQNVMTDKEARKRGIGGEVICYVY
ncbi:MAG: 30S ribosomal protein S8 [Cytophagales bacterium]